VPARRDDGAACWEIDLKGDFAEVPSIRLVLPAAFPAEACHFEVDPKLELRLPHVERAGRLCLRVQAAPGDYADPVGAVLRAIGVLQQEFLAKLSVPNWIESEFHHERLTYWGLHCTDRRRPTGIQGRIGRVYLDATELGVWADAKVAGYLSPGSRNGRFLRQVVSCGDTEPGEVASRHDWARGTMVKGHAMVVRIPEEHMWTPSTWPRTSQALDRLMRDATAGATSLDRLLATAAPTFKAYTARHKFRTNHFGKQESLPHAPPQLFVIIVQGAAAYGYRVQPLLGLNARQLAVEPFGVSRIDPDWALARDHALPQLRARRSNRVLLLGAGSLGSPIAHLLVRAGVGDLTIIDKELMEPENAARHMLGLPHLDLAKAPQLAQELERLVPGVAVMGIQAEACDWLSRHVTPGDFDLVIDCTAESTVRTAIAMTRIARFGTAPVVHAWIEPLCSAGHVVFSKADVPWPAADPADTLVNASDISAEDTRVNNPACSGGFHPYGAADVTQVAAFAVERILTVLAEPDTMSSVWSWVRSKAFFDELGLGVRTRAIVPPAGGPLDTATVTRSLAEVLRAA
jgi:sulfur-carrier protein adenylyltransferase/sulfurtransferase